VAVTVAAVVVNPTLTHHTTIQLPLPRVLGNRNPQLLWLLLAVVAAVGVAMKTLPTWILMTMTTRAKHLDGTSIAGNQMVMAAVATKVSFPIDPRILPSVPLRISGTSVLISILMKAAN
jgi:hypothetical protein